MSYRFINGTAYSLGDFRQVDNTQSNKNTNQSASRY